MTIKATGRDISHVMSGSPNQLRWACLHNVWPLNSHQYQRQLKTSIHEIAYVLLVAIRIVRVQENWHADSA